MTTTRDHFVTRAWHALTSRIGGSQRPPAVAPVRISPAPDGGPALPSPDLMFLVAGSEDPAWFAEGGRLGAESIRAILEKNGRRMEELSAVLDFGCGIGRVIRHFHDTKGPAFHGTDYNADLIGWCRNHLTFARFQVNELVGRLPYDSAQFDLVYALSVFTHLTEPQQRFWMKELSRVLMPGGLLLISTHGAGHLAAIQPSDVPDEERRRFAAGEMVVCGGEHAGTNICATFHPEAYVRETLACGYEAVDFVAEGALGNPRQDYHLLRKRV